MRIAQFWPIFHVVPTFILRYFYLFPQVKKRRLEREKEREEREKEMELIQREKESEYYKEWEKQEDRFHLEQALLRSKIRIQNGRAKPIDLLAKYISAEEDELAIGKSIEKD